MTPELRAQLRDHARRGLLVTTEPAEMLALLDALDAGDKFKAFVHEYLDAHGVPHGDPENQHQKEGCRIGARLDLLLAQLDKFGQDADMANGCLAMIREMLTATKCGCGEGDHSKGTPDMMMPEWIACIMQYHMKLAKEAGEARERPLREALDAYRSVLSEDSAVPCKGDQGGVWLDIGWSTIQELESAAEAASAALEVPR